MSNVLDDKSIKIDKEKVLKYEDVSDVIEGELRKRRARWKTVKIPWDEAAQIIRIRIAEKFTLYDQTRPFVNWINRVISHASANIIRDAYSRHAKPCIRCSCNEGGDLCRITPSKTQCAECPLYAKWIASKQQQAWNVTSPLTIEHHLDESHNIQDDFFDIEEHQKRLTIELKKMLSKKEFLVYTLVYIKNLTDEQIAEKMDFHTSEVNKKPGYRQLHNIKKNIIDKAKIIVTRGEIFD